MTRQRLYTGVWNKWILLFLTFFSAECFGAGNSADVAEGVYGYIRDENGSPVDNVDVGIFDGFAINHVTTGENGLYNIPEVSVSSDRYAVMFFTKDGYIPEALNIKVGEKKAIERSIVMDRIDTSDTGFIIGTIYQPVRGGKIKFQIGIYNFGKKRRVWLERDGKTIEKETDMEGHFLFEAPEGRYRLFGEGVREKVEVDISVRKTVIRNLRSGFVLVD